MTDDAQRNLGAGCQSTSVQTTVEQVALRRIATLVAQGAEPHELHAVVAEEVGRVVAAPSIGVVRYEPDSTVTVCGVFPPEEPLFHVGTRISLDGDSVLSLLHEHAASVRVDNYNDLAGEIADAIRKSGLRSSVGVPIIVAGRVWGAIVASHTKRLPENTGARLAEFTELLAAAIANADARRALAQVAGEQAALRRVATLVAKEDFSERVFAKVAEETGRLLGGVECTLLRNERDGAATNVGTWGDEISTIFPLESRFFPEGDGVAATVLRTGNPHRIDDYTAVADPVARSASDRGIASSVGCPIVVSGAIWGAIVVGTTGAEPFPPDTELRLTQFADLVATAVANAEARGEIVRLADQQAALRRVATLVAEGAPRDALFRAVAVEVASVIGPQTVTLSHHNADGWFTVVASVNNPGFPVGSRWPLEGPSLAATIHETGRIARIDDYANLDGAVAAAMSDSSMRAAAGSPIVVDGKVWGHISVAAMDAEPLPVGTEQRLLDFTELISTAISNAESGDALARLADEQAALRRVATLVARDASPGEVFNAVAMEVGKLLDTDITVVGRYDGDGAATATGSWSASPGEVPVGTRSIVGGRNVLTLVAETGRPARLDGYDDASGEAAEIAHRHGWRSSIAAPIIVEGRLWGVMLVATKRPEPLPVGSEDRLAAFTDLVATALANAQAHDEVRQFGEEQAALGRVATLVAAGATPEQVFKSVVDETSSLLDLELVTFGRFDSQDTATIIAASAEYPVALGSTWSLQDPSVIATVARTKRPARIDDYGDLEGEIARVARSRGFRSAIGAPLTIEGRLWGAIVAYSTDPEPIPEGSETRLGQFTELIATAVANAEARDALAQLADEQAALRRVATLVAEGVQPDAILSAVGEEIGRLFGSTITTVGRFEPDAQVLVALGVGKGNTGIAIGSRWALDDLLASAQVFHTGRSVRVDDVNWSAVRGPLAPIGDRLGVASTVASPIFVEGHLWGVVSVSDNKPLPAKAEERLEKFSELIATAIANAQSSFEIATLADEQAALRRVATLIAQGVEPEAIFSAVGAEIAGLFGSSVATVGRFESDPPTLVVVGVGAGGEMIPIGSRWELDERLPSARVFRTGLSVRVDEMDWSKVGGPVAHVGSSLGVVSTIASPIFIERRLWGVMTVSDDKQLPPDAERRLEKFSELIATAIANAENQSELDASRRRIVTAADNARRRIERDLHDGIQQRLIGLTFRARAMTRRPPDELPSIATELLEGLKDASDELREISRGIHPTILTEAGLGPALRALARRSSVPVDLDVQLDERLPAPIEAGAYYIASEALANVAKHAHANLVQLIARNDNGVLTLEIRDDGIGGVDATRGSGILGLTDRAEALGGTISINSPPRGGTMLSVRLPTTT